MYETSHISPMARAGGGGGAGASKGVQPSVFHKEEERRVGREPAKDNLQGLKERVITALGRDSIAWTEVRLRRN